MQIKNTVRILLNQLNMGIMASEAEEARIVEGRGHTFKIYTSFSSLLPLILLLLTAIIEYLIVLPYT